MKNPDYSVVIPVFNSATTVGKVVEKVASFFAAHNFSYEIILVNDASHDSSWSVISAIARNSNNVIAVNLIRNYGQHTALFCGFQRAKGNFVITLDDDLQNPPYEMIHLIKKAEDGHDVVFGRYKVKRHSVIRVFGSFLIRQINQKIFFCPPDLVPTNFRLIRRDVIDRILGYQASYPYITGLTLMFMSYPANVWVEHHERPDGKSNYTVYKLLSLVARILFNYSTWPLRAVSVLGLVISFLSFIFGVIIVYEKVFRGFDVEGWAGIVVMLALFNGLIIMMLGMLGEYTARILQQISSKQFFHIKEVAP